MKNDIKVSVIVPVFNARQYIYETAEFIKNQTLQDIEIIYVDDGSTDGSLEDLHKISQSDDRVQVLEQQNLYAGVARNNGLQKARGKYVVFWDSDDIFHPEALQEMYEKCEQDNADICICGANHYDEEAEKILKISTYLKKDKIPEYTPFGHDDIDKYLFNFSTNVPWNKMYNREFLLENNIEFQAIKQANDNYFAMKAYFYAKTFTVVDKPLIDYRINFSSSLTGKASDTPLCVYEAFKKTFEELRQHPEFENVRQSFINKTLRSLFYFLSKQTTAEAYKILYECYKDNVIAKWGFPTDEEYYYDKKDYNRLQRLREYDYNDFLISEYRKTLEEVRLQKNAKVVQKEKNLILKEKNLVLREKNQKLKEKKQNLTEKNANLNKEKKLLQSEINAIKNSKSYKIGRAITYIPRKVK